ncbi:hypothetical protein L0664_14215 [Octadecabacter sp. G9-8]|uniref:PilZ domain-containing protein n=1 Tax=Octadecabacter dasysiphoniae TaxID=2909341 RepID=A0ABS9CY81_9RHOB|nr:hypothetical protein [Octadecabacter dasysiphoniae]MCF2872226.1 hypothetical protein [Octadecabacter dasysiphoniae]
MASVCSQIYDLERLEARAGLLIERLSSTQAAPNVQATLDDIFARTRALQATSFRSQDLITVVEDYAASITTIRQQRNFRSTVGTAELLTAPAHRRLLRRMVAISHDACTFENTPTSATDDSQDTASRGFTNLPAITANVAIVGISVFSVVIAVVGYFAFHQMKLRKERRKRYLCNYTVAVTDGNRAPVDMQMLDVSAMGAKIRLIDSQHLMGTLKVKIGKRSLRAKVAWQNPHFVGLLFHRPLSLKFVKKLSTRLAERGKPPKKP